MAIFHLHVKNISREQGRSIVAAAAYRAGESLMNEAEERISNFGGRREVRHAEIRLPAGAPTWAADRASLWNAVDRAEVRKDARLAKEIEFALPRELPMAMWLEVAREMADEFVQDGFAVDLAIHEDGQGNNPHVHLLLTTRLFEGDGFGLKVREADSRLFVVKARARWEAIANAALAGAGVNAEIDARTNAARGLDKDAGKHRGPDRAERSARRARGTHMDLDTLEARRELLADKSALERFPLLRSRADWPPESPEPPSGLNIAERAEHKAFWREVTNRQLGIEQAPEEARDPSLPERIIASAADRAEQTLAKISDKAFALLTTETAGARDRRETSEAQELSQQMAEMRAAIQELRAENARQAAEVAAFRAQYPTISWEEADRYPVQGPEGELISPRQRDRAENAMLAEVEGPDRSQPIPPSPDRQPSDARLQAEDSMIRASHNESRDPDLAWLDQAPVVQDARSMAKEDPDLAWLRQDLTTQPSRDEPERDRDR